MGHTLGGVQGMWIWVPNGMSWAFLQKEEVKLLWDLTIQTDCEIHHRRPDIVIQKKKAKETIIVDIAVPGDSNVLQKETEK